MSGRAWKVFAMLAGTVIAAYQLMPDSARWQIGWQVFVGYAGVAGIVLGALRLPRGDRWPWWWFALGIFCNTTGAGVSIYYSEIMLGEAMPNLADPLFLGLYPACAVGLVLLIRRRDPRRNWTAVVDAALITTGVGLLAWVYVIQPAANSDYVSVLGRGVQAAYPIGDLLLLAMMARLLRGGGTRGVSFWAITASLGAFLCADTAWVVLDNLGAVGAHLEETLWVTRIIDMVYLGAYVLFGVAALHPAARELNRAGSAGLARLGRAHLALLTAASLIAPGILAVQLRAGEVTNGVAIVTGCVALFLLVVTRMAQLLREVERQARQLGELSRLDELTGLPNRRAWNDELPRALEHARRDGAELSVALLDLDHFKLFNDSYGHPAGDRLLKDAAAGWHAALRSVDTLARYGGEEFIVLLPGAGTGPAGQVVGRALAVTPLGQTFSAGVATWDGVETSDALIARADAALYAAKSAGRNRILPANGPVPAEVSRPREVLA
jgi:diguanylate cyclase (GGDEF)-like protein